MSDSINRMLDLTVDIAEELLLVKDAGHDWIPDHLKLKIIDLAELASTLPGKPLPAAPEPEGQPEEEPVTAVEAQVDEAEAQEYANDPEPEMLAEVPAAPNLPIEQLQKAFSVNDAFLFRREIFDGSKERFDQALDVISRLDNVMQLQHFLVEVLNLNLNKWPGKEYYLALRPYFKA